MSGPLVTLKPDIDVRGKWRGARHSGTTRGVAECASESSHGAAASASGPCGTTRSRPC
ncbi:hypothetical protein SCOCK_540012 [Actinacidiphila cocklensis]|uniref:Uncharacterized protein n=1 Tax=Actinacidiphila cocklensis TaxID=887465 RepID=A0A9W4DXU9_9ACTN|nr:hypothetical protein SCOCK_540012 [Actinacidiphila cocklensis]